MASSILKRVDPDTEVKITTLAAREGRTFVAQLQRVVDAGLIALGEMAPEAEPTPEPEPDTKATAPKRRVTKAELRRQAIEAAEAEKVAEPAGV